MAAKQGYSYHTSIINNNSQYAQNGLLFYGNFDIFDQMELRWQQEIANSIYELKATRLKLFNVRLYMDYHLERVGILSLGVNSHTHI